MKLVLSLITQGLEMEEMMRINLRRVFALNCHIANYMMSLCYLNLHDPLLPKKRLLYSRLMTAETINEQKKYFDMLWKFKEKEDQVILACLKQIEMDRAKAKASHFGRLWKPFTIGVKTIEFESYE